MSRRKTLQEETKSEWVWKNAGTLIYGDNGTTPSSKIASFDMDWTLIRTKTGKTFPKDENDWLIWKPEVPGKIQELHKDGYKIVIFTNQNGISKGHTTQAQICTKIQNLQKELGVPLQALMATADDTYKKPQLGIWEFFENKMNGDEKIEKGNKSKSFYCGDAAGRKGPPKDFSDGDLRFATNIDIPFFTPDQLFLAKKEDITVTGFNPKSLPETGSIFKEKDGKAKSDTQEMIVFCGSPGSGKSTFTVTNLEGYSRVNRDTLKTKEKCLKVAGEELGKGKSVVIDNTNPAKEDRALYVNLAKKHNVPVRCFYFDIPKELCFHLNDQRASNTARDHLSKKIAKVPIHSWYKNHVPPTKSEGFQEILTVQFVAGPFKDDNDKKMFYSLSATK